MDNIIQRVLEMFHHRVFPNMTPERRAGKLVLVNTLASNTKTDRSKEKTISVKNIKKLSFKRTGDKVTDSEDGEIAKEKVSECEVNFRRRLVRSAKPNQPDEQTKCKEELKRSSSVPVEVHNSPKENESQMEENDKHDFHTEVTSNLLNVQSVSVTNLLEEIEAGLPSSYSLANILDHTLHTVTNLRTCARLSRVGTNLTHAEQGMRHTHNQSQHENRLKYLQKEAFIQKTLIDQADKVVKLCKVNKRNLDFEDIESIKVLLLAKLRYEAINLELQNVKLSGVEETKEENFGEIEISNVSFTVNEEFRRGSFICVAFHKEHLLASNVQSQSVGGKLQFPVDFKFKNLRQNFILYIELYQLNLNSKSKREYRRSLEVKNLIKMAALVRGKHENVQQPDFECIGSASLRLADIRRRCKGRICVDYHAGFKSGFSKSIMIDLRTGVIVNSEINGFLDLFKDRYWYRLWCSQEECSLNFWRYPEDKDNGKAPVVSIELQRCRDAHPVSMDVCIRPHTFTIEYKEEEKNILLSASSHRDMTNWLNYVRTIISSLEAWTPDT